MIWMPGAAAWGDEVERFESDFDGAGEAEDAFHNAGEAGRDGWGRRGGEAFVGAAASDAVDGGEVGGEVEMGGE